MFHLIASKVKFALWGDIHKFQGLGPWHLWGHYSAFHNFPCIFLLWSQAGLLYSAYGTLYILLLYLLSSHFFVYTDIFLSISEPFKDRNFVLFICLPRMAPGMYCYKPIDICLVKLNFVLWFQPSCELWNNEIYFTSAKRDLQRSFLKVWICFFRK